MKRMSVRLIFLNLLHLVWRRDLPYASATFTFLDRESRQQSAIAYPITRVVLTEFRLKPVPGVYVVREFVAEGEGNDMRWREVRAGRLPEKM